MEGCLTEKLREEEDKKEVLFCRCLKLRQVDLIDFEQTNRIRQRYICM